MMTPSAIVMVMQHAMYVTVILEVQVLEIQMIQKPVNAMIY